MRRASLIVGLVALALIWAGPLLDAWRGSFAAHMLAHMGVVAVAAPLIAIGISAQGSPAHLASPSASPLLASLAELVVVWGWHAPAARLWAETSTIATIVEQTSFLACGLLLWLTCVAPRGVEHAGPRRRRRIGAAAHLDPHDPARSAVVAGLAAALRQSPT